MTTVSNHQLLSRFDVRRESDGFGETIDIVCKSTGSVIASFIFCEDAQIIEAEAQLMVDALNTLFDRGWCFHVNSLLKSFAANLREDICDQLPPKGL